MQMEVPYMQHRDEVKCKICYSHDISKKAAKLWTVLGHPIYEVNFTPLHQNHGLANG
jgi:hypothetical protein